MQLDKQDLTFIPLLFPFLRLLFLCIYFFFYVLRMLCTVVLPCFLFLFIF
jgi:hypothetical protein